MKKKISFSMEVLVNDLLTNLYVKPSLDTALISGYPVSDNVIEKLIIEDTKDICEELIPVKYRERAVKNIELYLHDVFSIEFGSETMEVFKDWYSIVFGNDWQLTLMECTGMELFDVWDVSIVDEPQYGRRLLVCYQGDFRTI